MLHERVARHVEQRWIAQLRNGERDHVPRLTRDLVGEIPAAGGQRFAQCRDRLAVCPVPLGAHTVQQRKVVRPGPAQLRPEELEQQAVVAVPELPARVARDEEVRGLELRQHATRVAAPCQPLGELDRQPVGDGGPEQELSTFLALAAEHLVEEVVGHGAVVTRKPQQRARRVRLVGERERGQPDPGRPALGPRAKRLDVVVGEAVVGRSDELTAFDRGKGQVRCADLAQLTGQAEPLQPQRRIGPRRQDHVQPRRRTVEQCLQLAKDNRILELVHVVEHENDRRIVGGESLDDAVGRGSLIVVGQAFAECIGLRECALDRGPEPTARVVLTVNTEPRRRGAGVDPGREQDGLAGSRVGGDERDAPGRCAIELLFEPGPRHEAGRTARRMELGGGGKRSAPVRARCRTRGLGDGAHQGLLAWLGPAKHLTPAQAGPNRASLRG